MARLGDRLHRRARETLVGREAELARLLAFAAGEGPLALHLHGLPGIGKTQLLHALADRLREQVPDVAIVSVDAGEVEPSPAGLCAWLAPGAGDRTATLAGFPDPPATAPDRQAELRPRDLAAAARAVTAAGRRVLLVVDRYETFRLLDTWLRQMFVPALGENVRVLLAGRAPPRPAWLVAPGWSGHLVTLELGPLPRDVALAYLTGHGIEPAVAAALERVAAGHPLALSMSAALVGAGAPVPAAGVPSAPGALVDHLAELFLEDVPDPTTRRVLQAACLVRTVTAPLVEAMLPDVPPEDALARLRALPFVRPTAHGLLVDDAVRSALDRALAATDPGLRADHRRAAADAVARQVRAARAELWRTTADVLYLLENPDLREAFFPRRANSISIEPATEADGPALREIIARHEGADAAAAFAPTWRHHRASCHVARDAAAQVAGLVQVLRPGELARGVLDRDPVLARWAQHLPAADDRARALWVRRLIDRDVDEQPSAAQAAAWLDIKRSYLELRPALRWVYACVRARAVHEPAMRRLGFRLLDAEPIRFSGQAFWSLVLDMGTGSVDGWLARLVAQEVGAGTDAPAGESLVDEALLDEAAHEAVVDGERIALTPLELGVLGYLRRRPGEAVTRHELLESVWKHPPDASTSNVVEAVVRSLRRKLGRHAAALATVRGVGYRFRVTGGPR